MSLFQLKPIEQSFSQFARNLTKKLRVIILCEGHKDIKTLKALIARMSIQPSGNIGITDCEGFPAVRQIAGYVASLARLSRRLEKMVLIADANEQSVERKVQSIIDSLRAHQVTIKSTETISESIYKAETEKLDILIKIAALMNLPFQKHAMEDYAVQLLIISGEVEEHQLDNIREAKDFLNQYGKEPEVIIRESQSEKVQQAFENVINLLNAMENT